MKVDFYTKDLRNKWNRLADDSGYVFLKRDFLESNGQDDCSVVVLVNDELILAIPAMLLSENRFSLYSSTVFGSVLSSGTLSYTKKVKYVHRALAFLMEEFNSCTLKVIPSVDGNAGLFIDFFYKNYTIETIKFVNNYYRRAGNQIDSVYRREWKKGIENGLEITTDRRLAPRFWSEVYVPHMFDKFNARPYYTDELFNKVLLENESIRFYGALLNGEIVAGTVLFELKEFSVVQFIASTNKGRGLKAVSFLFYELFTKTERNYLLGSALDGSAGREIESLRRWKLKFGSEVVQTMYLEF